jgi:NosR/NirI family nitrous oxide reductase transcriptional regulator
MILRYGWLLLAMLSLSPELRASSYEASLPTELRSDPDLCKWLTCTDVFPDADHFSPRMGRPAYVEAYRTTDGVQETIGYVFLSTDVVDIPAYSGKPVVTLIGMDTAGTIVGVKILKHSEPILLVGIPEQQLTKFILQFLGKKAWDKVEIGKARARDGYIGIDAISGATVTVIAQNQVMMRSANRIARQVGIIQAEPRPKAVFKAPQDLLDWATLVDEGSVQRLTVESADVGETDVDEPLIDIYFGYLNEPTIGRSILGEMAWQRLMTKLGPEDHAIFLVANGRTTFKGSGFVRGGIFDRIQVAQDIDTFTFRDTDYQNLYGIEAAGAPGFSESSIFIIRGNNFSAALPWSLVFLANKLDKKTGQREFANFDQEYWLADHYLEGGRPEVVKPEAAWVSIWKARAPEIVVFSLLLVMVTVAYANRLKLTRRSSHQNKWPVNTFKYAAWLVSIGFVGFGLLAQPSITQVLTWFHSLLFEWTWELFLSDPFIFIFWIFIVLTVFVWGRGLFCGWLCPFGSLTELLYKIGGKLGLARWQRTLPRPWHDRLKWLKYAIFFGLLSVSLFSMALAEMLAEVEPFKTTFLVGVMNRSWPYGLFVAVLLGLSLFIERPFCKYLCPLGAALAIPSTFRMYGLKRKAECSTCKACAKGCGSLAIDAMGRIDPRECLLCLDCMVLYSDDHACPPLAKERKSREKLGQPLTPISDEGYFTPLPGGAAMQRIPVVDLLDPRMPSAPAFPPYPPPGNEFRHLLAELVDHLWPWREFDARRALVALMLASLPMLGFALALGGQGHLDSGLVIGGFSAWCVFEIWVRLGAKPYVKEGPWWGRQYRTANALDMISYVGFKNLLIGASVFLVLKSMGWVQWSLG